jgi:DNA polymerase elongation subunit (family B)
MEEGPAYRTPAHFVPTRLSQSIQPLSSQETSPVVTLLVTHECLSVFEHLPRMSEIVGQQPPMASVPPIQTADHATKYVKTMIIEEGSASRGKLRPDPHYDAIICVAWAIVVDQEILESGMIYNGNQRFSIGQSIMFVDTKNQLYSALTDLVIRKNPDIVCGYNIERNPSDI